MKNYTIEIINGLTNSWLNGSDEKSKRAWRKLLKDIKNK